MPPENGEASQRFTLLTVNLEPYHSLVKEPLSPSTGLSCKPADDECLSAKRGRESRIQSAAFPFEFTANFDTLQIQMSSGLRVADLLSATHTRGAFSGVIGGKRWC